MTVAKEEALERARVLVEALPFIQKFHGETVVVKLGGASIEGAKHAGGESPVKMVLTGKVNPDLVMSINRLGGQAVGMSGEDGPCLLVKPLAGPGGQDLGLVGEVAQVNPEPITALLQRSYIPVVASIGLGYDGRSYNVNADSVAAELAVALGARKLILLTDVAGLMDAAGGLVSEIVAHDVDARIADGTITGGMIPKARACVRALAGCEKAHIIDGRVPHSLLLELLTEEGVGTMVVPG
jgi:acetylglutamate kinase